MGLPHQPRRVVLKRKDYDGRERGGLGGACDMQAHGVGRFLAQDQNKVIEAYHLTKLAGQLLEQRGQIAVSDDRLRSGQQGPVLVASTSCLSVDKTACHGESLSQPIAGNE